MTDPTDSEFDPPPSLSPQELARWETRGIPELTELLYWRWDPIGVSWAFPSAADEYHHYAKPLIDSLHAGASPQDIAFALHEIERTWITMETSDARRLEVAERMIEWYANSTWIWASRGAGEGDPSRG